MGTAFSLEKQGATARLTLHRDTIDGTALGELASACEAIAANDDIRVVVLSGEGDSFCCGWDWASLAREEQELPAALRPLGLPGDVFGCLAELPRAVVCAINGDALSAGLELALACDLRVAAENARFALPGLETGLLPLAGGIQRLARIAGRGKALEMLLTGEPVDAIEALRVGLVSAVVPRDRLLAEAEAIARRIAERGPLAVRYAKEAISRGLEMPLEQALRYEMDLTVILQTTKDRAEGVRAFLEKRKPEFRGK